jgi:hypothetical protein
VTFFIMLPWVYTLTYNVSHHNRLYGVPFLAPGMTWGQLIPKRDGGYERNYLVPGRC